MHWIDWAIILGFFGGLTAMATYVTRYMKSVSDFLAANRSAGRYLLTLSDGIAGMGAITIVANFEKFYQAGFGPVWWVVMLTPLGLLMNISGYVIYRYRETRAMTMAQFFEMRYSKRFRVFSGILAWGSGALNYGIFPAVTARFFIYFTGIPDYTWQITSEYQISLTMGLLMAIFLGFALLFTLRGGQIAVMITDFLQAQFLQVVFLTLSLYLLFRFGWSHIIETLQDAEAGKSMLNPFDQSKIPDFNAGFFIMLIFTQVYSFMSWQGNQGYNCSAKSPHEAKMSRVLGALRGQVNLLMTLMLPIVAFVVMHCTLYEAEAGQVNGILDGLVNPQSQKQMLVPAVMRVILPVGLFGLFAACMIGAAISTDDTYLHSWGSIFVQDVIVPLRKKPLSKEQHFKYLRLSIVSIAAFAWLFSLLFPLREFILMYMQLTGAIYMGGAGAAIIGGLYWKRGTKEGAWTAMIVGSCLGFGGVIINNIFWPYVLPSLQARGWAWALALPEKFPLNGMQMAFTTALMAASSYVIASLLSKPAPGFNLDKLLHRGEYAIEGEKKPKLKRTWRDIVGLTDECTRGDKVIITFVFFWIMFWFAAFFIGTTYNLIFKGMFALPEFVTWENWWLFKVGIMVTLGSVVTVWFLIGGFKDMAELFRVLRIAQRDDLDDGRVKGHEILSKATLKNIKEEESAEKDKEDNQG